MTRRCYVCGADRDDVPPCGAWRDGQRAECPLTTDVPQGPPIGFEGRAARAGAADATDSGGPFSFLPQQSPAQRAWLQRVCRDALDKRWQR
jgi:hypothetical protein